MSDKENTPRIAFFVMPTRVDSNGEYIALIAVEGEKGFYQTDWHWGKDFKLAEECADSRNTRLGLSQKEAAAIVCSTMKGIKMPEAEDETGDGDLERHVGVDKPEVWTTFDIKTIGDGSYQVIYRSNDDNDDGVDDGKLVEVHYKMANIQQAQALTGVSRTGAYGQPVTVTLDGGKYRGALWRKKSSINCSTSSSGMLRRIYAPGPSIFGRAARWIQVATRMTLHYRASSCSTVWLTPQVYRSTT